ncbi:MAG: hypothetical protein J6333_01090 [Planctomycetes bacterium]|nr:hypothetical protein [Planctomycetota bacterium]
MARAASPLARGGDKPNLPSQFTIVENGEKYVIAPLHAVEASPLKIVVNADSLPRYLFGGDAQNVTVGVAQGYGAKDDLDCELSVLCDGAVIVPARPATIPAFEQGEAQLRIPVAPGRHALPATLTLRVKEKEGEEDAERSVELPLFTLQPPRAAAPRGAPAAAAAAAPSVYCLPAFDETRLRRWQPVREFARFRNWLPFCDRKIVAALPDYGGEVGFPALVAEHFRRLRHCAPVVLDGCRTLRDAFLRLRAAEAAGKLAGADTELSAVGVEELANGVPEEDFAREAEALLALLQENRSLRVYVAGPPAFPARPRLRAAYAAALAKLCDKRSCRYLEIARDDDDFVTVAAPEPLQRRMAAAVTDAVAFGPGLMVLWVLPLVALSAAFWWLRSFSRFAPK